MIRVELGEEVRSQNKASKRRWRVGDRGLSGLSREPLLDACRAIKRMGGSPRDMAGLYWPGKDKPSLTCSVEVGAGLTVVENEKVGPVFAKWREPPDWSKRETPTV